MSPDGNRLAPHLMLPLIVSLVLLSGLEATASSESPATQPNFVLIITDDQGWTGTSVAMDPAVEGSRSDFYETPRFAEFATEALRFTQGYASGTMCSPSRAALQTGKTPARLHITDIIESASLERRSRFYENHPLIPPTPRASLPSQETTIAEFIKRHRPEYATAHFGKWHLGSDGPGKHGYDVHDGPTLNQDGQVDAPNPKDTFGVTDRAKAFMKEQVEQSRPFLMQVSYYAVHLKPYALAATRAKYEAKERGAHHFHAVYAAMTHDLDDGIGRLLSEIDRLGIREQTYVIYASDNGAFISKERTYTSNTPLSGGKCSVLEGGIRVPFAIRGPGIASGTVSHVPAVLHDLFPTIVELMDIDAALPDGVEGGSLADVARGRSNRVVRPREELVWHFPHYVDTKGVKPQSAIRMGNFKLVYLYESGVSRLYDLSSDISESRDLSALQPAREARMREALFTYFAAVEAELPRRR